MIYFILYILIAALIMLVGYRKNWFDDSGTALMMGVFFPVTIPCWLLVLLMQFNYRNR